MTISQNARRSGRPASNSALVCGVAVVALLPSGFAGSRPAAVPARSTDSFDSYFVTLPGANGIPMRHGLPTVWAPDPAIT